MTDTATEALLPCPFCGSLKVEWVDLADESLTGAQFVQCNGCEALGPVSRVDAIAAWNRRTLPAPAAVDERERDELRKRLALLEEALDGVIPDDCKPYPFPTR